MAKRLQLELWAIASPSAFACRPPCEEPTTGLRLPAAKNDPVSSRLAANDVERSGVRRRQIEAVVAVVREHPGHTSRELAAIDPSIDRYTYARRLPEAETLGLVRRRRNEQGVEKLSRCSISSKLAVTWELA